MRVTRQKLAIVLAGCLVLLLGLSGVDAQAPAKDKKPLELERLYSYPRLEGTPPIETRWSRDARKIAFLWNDKGYPFRDLWVYDLAATKLTRLTNLEQPRDQWTESPAEKDPKLKKYLPPETGLTSFVWAPDSSKLAFAFRGELYVVPTELAKRDATTRLTKTKESEASPKFAPDSSHLLFARENDLWVLDLATVETIQLTTDGTDDLLNTGSPDWSPDGSWISFVQTNRKGEPTRLIPNYAGREVTTRRQRRSFAKDETNALRLGIVSAAGGPVRWLTESARQYYRQIQWSPASNRIALLREEDSQKNQHLDVITIAEAAGVKTLYSESDAAWICALCNFLAWSPDGQQLLFSSERDGWNHLYLISAADTPATPRQLTRGSWEVDTGYRSPTEIRPRFSADGRRIYFTSTAVDTAERHLYVLALPEAARPGEASPPQRLTTLAGYNGAVVSPDEKWLALLYSSWEKPWELYLVANQAAAEPTRITRSPLPEFESYSWPQPKVVEFPARDGKKLRALLFQPTELAVDITLEMTRRGKRPSPRQAVQKVPAVVFVHGAGYAQSVLNRWGGYSAERFQFNQFLAQHG
jgi:dipeptidyl-peptidase-4